MKRMVMLASVLLPWFLRRPLLEAFFGYRLHPSARIGLSWVFPKMLVMEAGAQIGHLTVCKNMDLIHMKASSLIGILNWITGFPSGHPRHFAHETGRRPELILGEHSAITSRHLIDCTNTIVIGRFSTIAGFRSGMITHTIDLEKCRQSSQPITIGDYCFVGTSSVLLGGCTLPSYSVLGAKSLLNKSFSEEYSLYGGVPARLIQPLPKTYGYFTRTSGLIY
jgi:hypothetical protein